MNDANGNEGSIRSLPVASAHRMVAGQAVADMASAVKELVDNALDAGARSVTVRLISYGENAPGVDEIEVSGGFYLNDRYDFFLCVVNFLDSFMHYPTLTWI